MRKYGTLPLLAISDQRLTLRHIRVLAALSSFPGARNGPISPKRHDISGLTGLHETRVSHVTKSLEELGWIRKEGAGGKSRSTAYTICWDYDPQTVPDLSTVWDGQTAPDSGTVTPPQTVPDLSTVTPPNGARFEHRLDGQTVPDLSTVSGQTVPDLSTVSCQTVLKSGTVSEHLYEGSSRDICSTTTDTDTDLRSESVSVEKNYKAGEQFVFGHAVEVLIAHGVPSKFITRTDDRLLIVSWLDAGLTREQLVAACVRASECKRDGKPFGPRYVDQVLRSMQQEDNSDAASSRSRSGGFSKGDAIGEEWLRSQAARERDA